MNSVAEEHCMLRTEKMAEQAEHLSGKRKQLPMQQNQVGGAQECLTRCRKYLAAQVYQLSGELNLVAK